MSYVKGGGAQKNSNLAAVQDVYHSDNVFANFSPIALWQDPEGPEAAVFIAINSPSYKVDSATVEALEGETSDPRSVSNAQAELIKSGTITEADVKAGDKAGESPAATDTATPTPGVATTASSVTVETSVDDTLLYESPLTGIKYYVKTVTKIPGVVYPYDVATVAPQNGISVQEVCDNLKLLIINCFDIIKNQYPDAFMTCSFRKGGVGSPTSQHPKGMACDIQYSKASKADYYTRALWIRDNAVYDQFILEYKTTGTKNPWHHISFNSSGNRTQVLTFMNDKNCKAPGVQGLYDLSNA